MTIFTPIGTPVALSTRPMGGRPIRYGRVVDCSYVKLADGEFVIDHGEYVTIGVYTGRTRKLWGRIDCFSVKQHKVDTVVIYDETDPDGYAIWGAKGDPIEGTCYVWQNDTTARDGSEA